MGGGYHVPTAMQSPKRMVSTKRSGAAAGREFDWMETGF